MNRKKRSNSEPIINVKGRDFWGPPMWVVLHIVSATYRPENANVYKQFLDCYKKLLPCEICKKNLEEKIKMYPPDPYLTNNHDAFFYSYLLHDLANENITKDNPLIQKESPNYDNMKAFYFNALSQECKDCHV